MKKLILGSLFLILFAATFFARNIFLDRSPDYSPDPSWQSQVEDAVKEYLEKKYSYSRWIQDYKSDGDFLNYSRNLSYRDGPTVKIDGDGLPTVKYGDRFEYNPVTMTEFALTEYGKSLRIAGYDRTKFLRAADKLVEMQGPDGAFRYTFPWHYYRNTEPYQPGWVSGMAQGLALAALSRAYLLTHDQKYIAAGDAALRFLIKPVADGGTMTTLAALDPSLSDHIIFEEYISSPPNYTLNGYMFALLGVHDWANLKKSVHDAPSTVAKYFRKGINTLVRILPYYDIGGFSSYDLTHITFKAKPHIGVEYHYFHIALLHALHSVTGEPVLKKYKDLFVSQIERNPSTTGRD